MLLPAFYPVRRSVIDDEVGRGPDVIAVEPHIPGETTLPGHEYRIGVLVDFEQPEGVRGDRPVDQGIAGEAAVRLLSAVEEEPHHRPGAPGVPVGEQPGKCLIAVAGEPLTVSPPRMGRRGRN